MRKTVIGAILIMVMGLCASFSFAAEEKEKVEVITGKLTSYGKDFVQVEGDKTLLCKDCQVIEMSGNPITMEGLVATDTVEVTINTKEDCATVVKGLILRQ